MRLNPICVCEFLSLSLLSDQFGMQEGCELGRYSERQRRLLWVFLCSFAVVGASLSTICALAAAVCICTCVRL